jgi:hypothetical protein
MSAHRYPRHLEAPCVRISGGRHIYVQFASLIPLPILSLYIYIYIYIYIIAPASTSKLTPGAKRNPAHRVDCSAATDATHPQTSHRLRPQELPPLQKPLCSLLRQRLPLPPHPKQCRLLPRLALSQLQLRQTPTDRAKLPAAVAHHTDITISMQTLARHVAPLTKLQPMSSYERQGA